MRKRNDKHNTRNFNNINSLFLTYNRLKTETSLKTNIMVLLLFPIGLINVFADLMN